MDFYNCGTVLDLTNGTATFAQNNFQVEYSRESLTIVATSSSVSISQASFFNIGSLLFNNSAVSIKDTQFTNCKMGIGAEDSQVKLHSVNFELHTLNIGVLNAVGGTVELDSITGLKLLFIFFLS